jgi:hypothetical protein
MRRKLNFVLVVLAFLGILFVLDTVAHHSLSTAWPYVVGGFAFSTVCLVATREREWLDVFLTAMAGLLALFAAATTTAVRQHPRSWLLFWGFALSAGVLILLTRKKREALVAIAAIVGFRMLLAAVVFLRS